MSILSGLLKTLAGGLRGKLVLRSAPSPSAPQQCPCALGWQEGQLWGLAWAGLAPLLVASESLGDGWSCRGQWGQGP